MHVLVTGGAGFLGSHLCERLLQQGHAVTCLDNLGSGREENLSACLSNPRFRLLRHNVQQPFRLKAEQIYHLAGPASPAQFQRDLIENMKTAFLGTLHTLELARELGVPALIASTAAVYGDPLVHPQSEVYWGHVNPVGPRACYDEGARAAEALAADYRRIHGVDGRIVRIFNTYGPRMRPEDGGVIGSFIAQALAGQPLTVYGSGTQTRSFCYVEDLVLGLMLAMNAPQLPGPVNLGNPHEVPVVQLAGRVIALTGSPAGMRFEPLPTDDPARRRPDIGRAREVLGWEPRMALDEGLRRTIDHFAANGR